MVSFVNTFLSYLLLMVIILIVGGIGFSIGLFLRKKKNQKNLEVSENME